MPLEITRSVRLQASLAICAFTLIFAHHFLLVFATNLPASPLTRATRTTVQRYIFPYFAQRWTFFAPQPIERTFSLVARGAFTDDTTKQSFVTPWSDVSKPLVDQIRDSRFAPLSLVQLGLANTVVEYMGIVSRTPQGVVADPRRPGQFVIKNPIPAQIAPLDRLYLTRTAAASLEAEYPHQNFSKIQLAVTVHVFPRFEHRFEKDDLSRTA